MVRRPWSRVSRVGLSVAAFSLAGVCAAGSASAAPGSPVITGYAGTGTAAPPTPGPATSSAIGVVTGIATDAAGNLYIVDRTNAVVEKVTPDGTLSVIAGTVGSTGSPVPGPATSSGFNYPQSVAVDGAGNVYISDQDNYVVEKVTPDGTLSVIAGNGNQGTPTPGPATSSALGGNAFGGTQGLAVDAAGNVYIADAGANVVEKVTPDGTLSIVAGNANGSSGVPTQGPATSSALNQPFGVAFDAAGNLYIADRQNRVVEKVTPGGTLSIIAGNGTSGSPTPGPATSSRLGAVYGLAVNAAGDVYLADYSNSRIELITTDGTLSVLAGNGTAGAPTYGGAPTSSALHSPIGVAAIANGTVYIDDEANLTIDRVGLTTPGAPGTPVATAGDGSAQLSFTAPIDQGTSPITSYQTSVDAGQTWQTITTTTGTGTTLNATLTGLSDGTTYAVRVRAVNTAGPGADSPAGSVTPVGPPVTTTTPTTTTPMPTTTTPTPTTPITTGTPPLSPPTVGIDATTAATGAKGQSALLNGIVAAHASAVSYAFQYGAQTSYGKSTQARILTASPSPQAVRAAIGHLVPGRVYHYRLAVTAPTGTVSYGADMTLKTPRVAPRRVRDHIYSYWDQHAPYHYRVNGRMILARGLSHRTACQTHGTATVTVTRGKEVLARHTIKITSTCTYHTSLSFSAHQLPGSGRMSFHMRFAGNRQLRARQALTLNVLYGPHAKTH